MRTWAASRTRRMPELCDWCVALSGRFNAHRVCCEVRLLAGAPAHARTEAYKRARQLGGAPAEQELKSRVKAEYERQNGPRKAMGREALAELKEQLKGATA